MSLEVLIKTRLAPVALRGGLNEFFKAVDQKKRASASSARGEQEHLLGLQSRH